MCVMWHGRFLMADWLAMVGHGNTVVDCQSDAGRLPNDDACVQH